MPSLPSLLTSAAKTASGPAGAALSSGRRVAKAPGSRPKRVITPGRAALAGGVVAGAASVLLRRKGSEAPPSAAGPGPGPSVGNYDAAGPPSDTGTSVPVIDSVAEPLGIDEQAEVEAAAAEAGNIGGPEIDYASAEPDMRAGDAEAAVFEDGSEASADTSEGR